MTKLFTGTTTYPMMLLCEVDAVNGAITALRVHPVVKYIAVEDSRGSAALVSAPTDTARRMELAAESPEAAAAEQQFVALEAAMEAVNGAAKGNGQATE